MTVVSLDSRFANSLTASTKCAGTATPDTAAWTAAQTAPSDGGPSGSRYAGAARTSAQTFAKPRGATLPPDSRDNLPLLQAPRARDGGLAAPAREVRGVHARGEGVGVLRGEEEVQAPHDDLPARLVLVVLVEVRVLRPTQA